MRLVKPSRKYAKGWAKAIEDLNREGTGGFWNIPEPPKNFTQYKKRTILQEKGLDLPDYWAPASTYWLIDDGRFVGHVNIRHKLNKKLLFWGGHIGYTISPSERKKGYGTKILELAIKKAKKLGIKRILLTCNDKNIASQKIIEKHGGKLKNKVETKEGLIRRYWINLY